MFRLSRFTDYGIRILAHLASSAECGPGAAPMNAREVADELSLPLPIVSKVMKALARAKVLESHRGSKGGFNLTLRPRDLTVADMITVLEGPVALMQCSADPSECEHAGSCTVQEPWGVINLAVENTLSTITLADLISPTFPLAKSALTLQVQNSVSRVQESD